VGNHPNLSFGYIEVFKNVKNLYN
jgi:hypothetical protein